MNNDFKVTMSFAAAVAAAAFSLAAHGAVVYVSPDGKGVDEGGTGTLAQPYDIYTGVAQAGDGGEVRLLMSENRYFLTSRVYVNKRTLRGWNGTSDTPAGSDGRDKVILDGGETVECLYSANLQGSWTIADLTITRGCPTKEGSLLYGLNVTGNSVVSNCVFRESSCTNYMRCVRVSVYEGGSLRFINCDFRELEALDWYGFLNVDGAPDSIVFDRCRFINNVNSGPQNSYGSFAYGNADFTDCVISNNTGTGIGGFSMGRSSWTRCLFADKYSSCNVTPSGDVRFWNCFSQYGFMPEGQGNVCGTSQLPLDPGFVAAASDDYRLKERSLCTDAGLDFAWMSGAKDLQSLRRPRRIEGRSVDIGCYEYLWPSGLSVILK